MKRILVLFVALLSLSLIGCLKQVDNQPSEEETIAYEVDISCETYILKTCKDRVCEIHDNVSSFYVDANWYSFKKIVTMQYENGLIVEVEANRCILLGCGKN